MILLHDGGDLRMVFKTVFLLKVYDDERLLACRSISETHFQTAGGRSRPHPLYDVQSGEKLNQNIIHKSAFNTSHDISAVLGKKKKKSFLIVTA